MDSSQQKSYKRNRKQLNRADGAKIMLVDKSTKKKIQKLPFDVITQVPYLSADYIGNIRKDTQQEYLDVDKNMLKDLESTELDTDGIEQHLEEIKQVTPTRIKKNYTVKKFVMKRLI